MIDLQTLVSGTFTARRKDSRNNNFIVNKEYDHHNYFVKQVKANDVEKIETLRTEAACYALAHTNSQYSALKKFLPAFHQYDPLNNVLVIEQIKDAFSVNDFYFQFYDFRIDLPERIAETLASYNNTASAPSSSVTAFRQQKPWIFTLTSAPPFLSPGSQASVEHQIVQLIMKNGEFVQLLRTVDAEWLPSALTHNDVKFNNFLLNYDYEHKKINGIKLIDWELADIGDPLWDAAAVMENFLMLWINTDIPEQPGVQLPFKKISLQEVQPCIDRFWKRYTQQLKWDKARRQLLLLKAVKFAALKLIHACFEIAPTSTVLQPMCVKMLQISLNILRSPQDAAIRLFGINESVPHAKQSY